MDQKLEFAERLQAAMRAAGLEPRPAVLLNLFFNHVKFARQKPGSSVFVAADRFIAFDEVQAYSKLREGDHIEGGRIVDADGKPLPVRRSDGELVDVPICADSGGH